MKLQTGQTETFTIHFDWQYLFDEDDFGKPIAALPDGVVQCRITITSPNGQEFIKFEMPSEVKDRWIHSPTGEFPDEVKDWMKQHESICC